MIKFFYSQFIIIIKGIVQPKMKNLSSFTLPQGIPNPYEIPSSAKPKIFCRLWVTKQLTVPTDFHSMENKQYGDHQLFGNKHSSKSLLCSAEESYSYRF